jgi:phosphoribosyl 1,2-cyclic phosphodiesterase
VIEANHDEHLLLNGPYPTYLKQRILSPRGHQSNDTCGELLVRNYHEGLRNVWLCHLSQENNDPIVAFETVRAHLEQIGVVPGKNIFLKILARTTAGKAYPLNEQILPQEELNPNEDN